VVSIHHQELGAVVFYAALSGILQAVEAGKNVCFNMDTQEFAHVSHFFAFSLNTNYKGNNENDCILIFTIQSFKDHK
jgi:hypothetical protein